ncbi:MAG: alpha/beta hydrolase [Chloroflexi bacterium]|nr:alpha/beta hydrolase [Chloroflexota bacterium]MBI2976154.1 alpha/beta hydrolase [Chloroflexota bacterium]
MSSIVTDQGIVHYETYGQGKPVVLLHGWLGSWGLWQRTMELLGRSYRTYALDFWGFGESGKKRETYAVGDFVTLVDQFMDKLGIESAPVVGHSMGGTVSLSMAFRFPRRVQKVVVVGSPIVGSSLNILLQLAGYRPIAFVVYNLPIILRLGLRAFSPLIVNHDPLGWYHMQERDLSKTTLESFFASIGSLQRTDLRPRLAEVKMPTLGIYGAGDTIVHPRQYEALKAGVSQAEIEIMHGSRHFPMIDEPEHFNRVLKDFLDR